MDPIIIYSTISLIAGLVVGVLGFKFGLKSQADAIIKEAKVKGDAIKEKKISQAKQKFFELKEKQKSERKDLDRKLKDREDRIRNTEKNLNKQIDKNKELEKVYPEILAIVKASEPKAEVDTVKQVAD